MNYLYYTYMEFNPNQSGDLGSTDSPEATDLQHEQIRSDLRDLQQAEIERKVQTAHLVGVDIEKIPNEDLDVWLHAKALTERVQTLYYGSQGFSDVEYWDTYDDVDILSSTWENDRERDASDRGLFYAYIANVFVTIAIGRMALLDDRLNQEAKQSLVSFKDSQEGRTAYLREAEISDLVEHDIHAYRILKAVETSEQQLQEGDLLELARKYAYLQSVELIAHLDEQSKQKVLDYTALSNRLHDMWQSWSDIHKLDKSRLEFYEYLANRIQGISGHQSLA